MIQYTIHPSYLNPNKILTVPPFTHTYAALEKMHNYVIDEVVPMSSSFPVINDNHGILNDLI